MEENRFEVALQHPFDLKKTVESHGWCQLAPWKWNGATLERIARLENFEGRIEVKQKSPKKLLIETDSSDTDIAQELVSRWLHLDWDPSEFLQLCAAQDPEVGSYVRAGGGRFLRSDTFYEDVIKTICTINTTWKQTKSMVSALVYLNDGKFPYPLEMLEFGVDRLMRSCKLGFRSKTINDVTKQLLEEHVIRPDGSLASHSIGYHYLLSLKGIGPYSASHIMMLLRDFSSLPVDSEVSTYLREKGLDPKRAQDAFDGWSDYRFLGYKLKRIIDHRNWIGD